LVDIHRWSSMRRAVGALWLSVDWCLPTIAERLPALPGRAVAGMAGLRGGACGLCSSASQGCAP
jgi:hypothetical protein